MNYAAAMEGFLSLISAHMKKVEEFSSPRDIALYIAVLAIVHYSRRDIQNKVSEPDSFSVLINSLGARWRNQADIG